MILHVAALLLATMGPPPLARLAPPYAAAYLEARPEYRAGRSRAPEQPWYYLPRPVLGPRPRHR